MLVTRHNALGEGPAGLQYKTQLIGLRHYNLTRDRIKFQWTQQKPQRRWLWFNLQRVINRCSCSAAVRCYIKTPLVKFGEHLWSP